MLNHLMVDLETMSSDMDAAIVAIGAVLFDTDGPELVAEEIDAGALNCFYANVDLASSMRVGLKPSASTIMWWLKQAQGARDALVVPQPIDITIALAALAGFIKAHDIKYVWAHANFDLSILATAYNLCGIKLPWKYYDARDVRTIYATAFNNEKVPGVPTELKHNALWDAYRQAVGVQICYKQ